MELFFAALDNSVAKCQQEAEGNMLELISNIQNAKAKVLKLGESVRDGLLILDSEWRFTYLNQQAELLLKRTRKDLLGKVIWEEFPGEVGTEVHKNYLRAVNEQIDIHFESYGQVLGSWEEIHAYPSPEGLIVSFRDITKQCEQRKYLNLIAAAVKSSQDAIITGTIAGVITSWNPGAEFIYGFSEQEAIGQHISLFLHPQHKGIGEELLARVSRGETVDNQYGHHRSRQGNSIFASVSVFPLCDPGGAINGFAAIMRDVTEPWRSGQELRHFFNLSADILIITDYCGRIMGANQAFHKIMGYTAEEVVGQTVEEFIFPEDLDMVFESWLFIRNNHQSGQVYEARFRHRDGSERIIQWNAVPIEERRCYFAVARDLTVQRQLEQQLDRSNRRSNKILDSIKGGFFALDRWAKITYINRTGRELGNKKSEKLVGRCLWDIFPHSENSTVYKQFNLAMENQLPLAFECWVTALKGWFEFNIFPTSNGGLLVYFYDLSEVINTRQQLQRLERLQVANQMAAGISHEIRNPLTTVRGFLQVLHESHDFGDYQSYFEVMIDELDRANAIITEFLNLAKDKPTQLARININQIIEKLHPLIEANICNRGHRIVIGLDYLPELMLNEGEIRQLILNLINNAVEAMEQPGCISINTYMEAGEAILSISDQGNGIPPEVMDKIGTPFFTTKEVGTGLGLATCFSIAKRHEARIELKSSTEGTKIMIRFNTQESRDGGIKTI